MESKTILSRHLNSLMAWPDWPLPHILRQIYPTGRTGSHKLMCSTFWKVIIFLVLDRSDHKCCSKCNKNH